MLFQLCVSMGHSTSEGTTAGDKGESWSQKSHGGTGYFQTSRSHLETYAKGKACYELKILNLDDSIQSFGVILYISRLYLMRQVQSGYFCE